MIRLFHCKDLKYETENFQYTPVVMTQSESIPGYFLTDSELQQRDREMMRKGWDARDERDSTGFWHEYKDFEDFIGREK